MPANQPLIQLKSYDGQPSTLPLAAGGLPQNLPLIGVRKGSSLMLRHPRDQSMLPKDYRHSSHIPKPRQRRALLWCKESLAALKSTQHIPNK